MEDLEKVCYHCNYYAQIFKWDLLLLLFAWVTLISCQIWEPHVYINWLQDTILNSWTQLCIWTSLLVYMAKFYLNAPGSTWNWIDQQWSRFYKPPCSASANLQAGNLIGSCHNFCGHWLTSSSLFSSWCFLAGWYPKWINGVGRIHKW